MTGEITEEPFLTRREAADFCKSNGYPTTVGTLGKLATVGGGPLFQKSGPGRNAKALYTKTNLLAWIKSRVGPLRESTSSLAA